MSTITACMVPLGPHARGSGRGDNEKEAEAACRCAESWVTYGIGAE
jgi:hypothetical protein